MIYVLRLHNDKYYVGYSKDDSRVGAHFRGEGSSWTRMHAPLEIIERFDGDKTVEKEVTLRYMREKGWENVRGAGWTAADLKHCPRELWHS